MAEKLIEKWMRWAVAENLKKFDCFNKDIEKEMIEEWYWDIIVKNPEKL